MKIAFYAPLKSPNHSKASGDRAIARSLYQLMFDAGYEVNLASELRTWTNQGEQEQKCILDASLIEANRLLKDYNENPSKKPDIWFTYHCYHKAPDWIGQIISKALKIPYIIAEMSISPKQANGKWALGYESSLKSAAMAHKILCLNQADRTEIVNYLRTQSDEYQGKIIDFKLFIEKRKEFNIQQKSVYSRKDIAKKHTLDHNKKWLVTVAQMRHDAKLVSYKILANTMKLVESHIESGDNYQHIIIGSGAAYNEVKNCFSRLKNTLFLGELPNNDVLDILKHGYCMVWPGYDEAIGVVYLESLACGLPIIASANNSLCGINNIIAHNESGIIIQDFDVEQFANAIIDLLNNDHQQKLYHENCLRRFHSNHSYQQATVDMQSIINSL